MRLGWAPRRPSWHKLATPAVQQCWKPPLGTQPPRFTDARRFAPDMEEMLRKIRVEPVEQAPGVVTVTAQLKDGTTVSEACRGFRGSATNPMTRAERLDKVWDCVGRVLSTQDAERVIALLEDLENVPDISALLQIIGQTRM